MLLGGQEKYENIEEIDLNNALDSNTPLYERKNFNQKTESENLEEYLKD